MKKAKLKLIYTQNWKQKWTKCGGFYHDKGHQIWLFQTVDHKTDTPIAFWFGTRKHEKLDKLIGGKVYADNNFAVMF